MFPAEEYSRPASEEPRIVWGLPFLSVLQLAQFPFGTLTLVPTLLLAALIAAIATPIAVADQRVLYSNGHIRRTSPVWAVLPVVYLAIRGSRRFDETQRGMTPFWVALAVAVVVGYLLFWGPEGIVALLL